MIQSGRASLNNRYCWVDTWAFERILGEIEAFLKQESRSSTGKGLEKLTGQALSLYHGHFLGEHENEPWSVSLRERLRSKFIRMLLAVGRYWEDHGEWDRAIDCYQKGLELDGLIEVFYQRLITCYGRRGRKAEALALLRRCRRIFSILLGVQPSEETEAIMQRLLQSDHSE